MIPPRIESTSQVCLVRSPYRTSTSESTGHTVTGMGKAPGCKDYFSSNQLAKQCRKKKYDSIHDRYIRDKTFRKAMIEVGRSEKIIKEMDQLASENHTYKATKAEIDVYRGNWWIHSNVANFDSVPTRHQPDFKKALSTMHRLQAAETRSNMQNGHKVPPLLRGNGKQIWWESDYEYTPQDGMTTDCTGQPVT